MKLIELKQAQRTALANLKNHQFKELSFYTWKKDRSVVMHIDDSGDAYIVESGYHNETIDLPDAQKAKHVLKQSFNREFPRSHKVYFSSIK
ncbi:MAG: hypothetical protein H9901_03475 [Candidatus Paralactobacillus gallistercoris]|uniref:Uncharacterized protein n=1 Tax=Candidatus Paralactobacillus gallistercoris TaxID=2838724 RepID=A0A948TJ68_9LACO|nr:hypothetical protein [Candidatus Paralactobacillus gallistercoris]